MPGKKKIFIGSDHGGFALKNKAIKFLESKGYRVWDAGTYTLDSCDYPIAAFRVARSVAIEKNSAGILICRSGIGSSIAANKIPGIRAALCFNERAARLSREHNDANILVLGADFINKKAVNKIINTWLNAKFQGGRHKRRVDQISHIEKKVFKKI